VRHRFLRGLLAMAESRSYRQLGYSTIHQYAEKHFGYRATWTSEAVRVAKALPDLPRSTSEFEAGDLSWSALREITRVASRETEGEWLEFGKLRPFLSLKAEVQDAVKKKRDRPRLERYGLPRIRMRLVFELEPEGYDMALKSLKKAARELSESAGGKEASLEEPFLFLAERMHETDPAGPPKDRIEREAPLYTLLYQMCQSCRVAHVRTSEGPVEVPAEVIERVEADAERITISPEEERPDAVAVAAVPAPPGAPGGGGARKIDRPTPAWLMRKVAARDGFVCSNPYCRRKLDNQNHHIELRSEGGPTNLWNLARACLYCHSALHSGLIRIERDSEGKIRWIPRGEELDLKVKAELNAEEAEVTSIPVVIAGGAAPGLHSVKSESEPGKAVGPDPEPLVRGLMNLGYTKREARERIERAFEKLRQLGEPLTEEEILRRACAG